MEDGPDDTTPINEDLPRPVGAPLTESEKPPLIAFMLGVMLVVFACALVPILDNVEYRTLLVVVGFMFMLCGVVWYVAVWSDLEDGPEDGPPSAP